MVLIEQIAYIIKGFIPFLNTSCSVFIRKGK